MNVVFRFVKSFSGPPEPASRYAGPGPASPIHPPGVRLWRNRVSEVLERVEDVHRAVLDAVLVPRDQAASDLPVVRVLAVLVQDARAGVQALDDAGAHG